MNLQTSNTPRSGRLLGSDQGLASYKYSQYSQRPTDFQGHDYEVLIKLYDANYDEHVALTDGLDDSDLRLNPLESEDYDVVTETLREIMNEHGGSS